MRNYKLFIDEHPVCNNTYCSGIVAKDDTFFIEFEQIGGADTFRIGMPVYDKDHHLMGYLGIGFYHNLDYSSRFNDEAIPVERWEICNPTKYCEVDKSVYTYNQRWNIECIATSDNHYITCVETIYNHLASPDFIQGKQYLVIAVEPDGCIIQGENYPAYLSNTQIDSFFRGK